MEWLPCTIPCFFSWTSKREKVENQKDVVSVLVQWFWIVLVWSVALLAFPCKHAAASLASHMPADTCCCFNEQEFPAALQNNQWGRPVDYPRCAADGCSLGDPLCDWRSDHLVSLNGRSVGSQFSRQRVGDRDCEQPWPASKMVRLGERPGRHACEAQALRHHGLLPTRWLRRKNEQDTLGKSFHAPENSSWLSCVDQMPSLKNLLTALFSSAAWRKLRREQWSPSALVTLHCADPKGVVTVSPICHGYSTWMFPHMTDRDKHKHWALRWCAFLAVIIEMIHPNMGFHLQRGCLWSNILFY